MDLQQAEPSAWGCTESTRLFHFHLEGEVCSYSRLGHSTALVQDEYFWFPHNTDFISQKKDELVSFFKEPCSECPEMRLNVAADASNLFHS